MLFKMYTKTIRYFMKDDIKPSENGVKKKQK